MLTTLIDTAELHVSLTSSAATVALHKMADMLMLSKKWIAINKHTGGLAPRRAKLAKVELRDLRVPQVR